MTTTEVSLIPHVVILGAGYAGALLARSLQRDAKLGNIRLTVIERREFMQ
jgi:NADH dehydrogenase FAD-containing subunit